jgi:alkylation response protein AidB-like acyl-CoA dehydrogenase
LNDEYLAKLERVSAVAAAHATDVDRAAVFPKQSIDALAHEGLLGTISATEVGGLGLGIRAASEAVERLARECGSTAMVLCMHFCAVAVIERFGSQATREQLASGKALATLAFSEVGSRSQFWVPVSRARAKDGHIMLDAKKSWVTSARNADLYVWSSRPLEASDAVSTLWLVPARSGGLRSPVAFDGLGLRGNDSCPVTAEDVRVAKSDMLGNDGQGFEIMMQVVLPHFNVMSAACSVGLMEAATTRSAQHVAGTSFENSQSTIAELPTVRAAIGRMRVKTDAARAMSWDAASAVESERQDALLRVLECKASAGDTALEVLDLGMRACGGAAFRRDLGIERYFRDARAAAVMAPTSDVLYDFVGKLACGMPLF